MLCWATFGSQRLSKGWGAPSKDSSPFVRGSAWCGPPRRAKPEYGSPRGEEFRHRALHHFTHQGMALHSVVVCSRQSYGHVSWAMVVHGVGLLRKPHRISL
jgi:hypothetical protein